MIYIKLAKVIKSRRLDIFILAILTFIAHRGWFRPGMLDYGDSWAIPREALVTYLPIPYIWTSLNNLGAYFSHLYIYPVGFWFPGLIACLGFDYGVIQRIVYFFPYLILVNFSMYYFTYTLYKNRVICFFATLLFVFNTCILTNGIIAFGIAYALCPLVLVFFVKGLEKNKVLNGILVGIFLSLTAAFNAPTAYLMVGALFLYFVDALIRQITNTKDFKIERVTSLVSYLLFVLFIPIVLFFYWILPSLFVMSPFYSTEHNSVGWVYTLSYAKLSHAIGMYSIWWPPGSSGIQPVRIQYFIVPLMVIIGIVARFKDRNVRLLAIIALISVFFAKGTNKPFGEIYPWLFKHFPLWNMFRVPGKFTSLTCLAYAPLLGIGIDFLANTLKNIEPKRLKISFKNGIFKGLFLIFMFCFMMYLTFPALAYKMGGHFEARPIPKEYGIIKKFIINQPPHFRTFWYPIMGRYAFYSQEYPLISAAQDNSTWSTSRFTLGFDSQYFLNESEAFKQTRDIAKILGIVNVKYCFLPQEKEHLPQGKDFYLKTFKNQSGLKKINIGENIYAFENQHVSSRFFITEHSALVVGGLKALYALSSLPEMNLSEWAIFFSDQLQDDCLNFMDSFEAIVFYGTDIDDLILALMGEEYRVDFTKYVRPRGDNPPGTWSKTDFLSAGISPGITLPGPKGEVIYRSAHGEVSELNSPIPIIIKESQDYEIWIRPVAGPNKGVLSILASEDKEFPPALTKQILTTKDLKDDSYPPFSLRWIKAGTFYLPKGRVFFRIIHHSGPIGIVEQFVIVPKKIMDGLRTNVSKSFEGKEIIIIKEPDTLSVDMFIPQEDNYRIAVDINNSDFSGNLSVKINGDLIKKENVDNSSNDFWLETSPVKLTPGLSNVTVSKDTDGKIEIKKIIIYKAYNNFGVSELFKISNKSSPVAWQEINPTKYHVRFKAEKPTFLIFSESFNKNWVLSPKKPVFSTKAYGMLNSFFINQPGQIDAIIEFTPQRYVYRGLWVSGIGFILICLYLLWQAVKWARRR